MKRRFLKVVSSDEGLNLTGKELSCLTLAANGYRAVEMSRQLNVSSDDIDALLGSAERKLGARNRLHAIGIAVCKGLIGIESK